MHSSVCISLVISLWLSACHAQAKSTQTATWLKQTESRLTAIYERGEFRPQKFQAEWLADSSGYTVQELDPKTEKVIGIHYSTRTGERSEVKPDDGKLTAKGSMLSPDGKRLLEFRDQNLFVRELKGDQLTQLTWQPTDRDIRYRDPVWSPDGKQIALVESDSTHVRKRAVLLPDDPSYPSVQNNTFARVGEKIEILRVGISDFQGKNMKWLPIESPEEGIYLGQVEWAGNSKEVLVERFSRFRDQRSFVLATANGEVKQIFYESNDAWAESSQGKNSGLTWIQDGKKFVVVSEKDGWRHAFLWSREGKELALLTPGDYDVIDRGAIDEDGGWYYFYASPDNGTQKYLHRVPLDGSGSLERITPADQPGTHGYDFSPDRQWAIHTYSTIDSPPRVELVELTGHRVIRMLEDNIKVRETMKSVLSHPTEFLKLNVSNGVSMDAWMIKPRDFDESKKYPVFVYVYGEPHAQTVLDEWGVSQIDFHRVVADLGYLVVSIDNRGTPAPKGAAWRRSIFGSLGPLSTEEQEAGLQELGRIRPFVDLTRVGIWGWSSGGSNTLNAMFRKPDSYHVGIAVVPKPQPHLYNAWSIPTATMDYAKAAVLWCMLEC